MEKNAALTPSKVGKGQEEEEACIILFEELDGTSVNALDVRSRKLSNVDRSPDE
jgi:hypothetical protein